MDSCSSLSAPWTLAPHSATSPRIRHHLILIGPSRKGHCGMVSRAFVSGRLPVRAVHAAGAVLQLAAVDVPAGRPPLPPGAPTPPLLLPCPPPGHPPLPHKTEPRFRSSHSCSCRSTRRRGRNPKRGRGPHLPPDEALPWIICAIRGLPLPT